MAKVVRKIWTHIDWKSFCRTQEKCICVKTKVNMNNKKAFFCILRIHGRHRLLSNETLKVHFALSTTNFVRCFTHSNAFCLKIHLSFVNFVPSRNVFSVAHKPNGDGMEWTIFVCVNRHLHQKSNYCMNVQFSNVLDTCNL